MYLVFSESLRFILDVLCQLRIHLTQKACIYDLQVLSVMCREIYKLKSNEHKTKTITDIPGMKNLQTIFILRCRKDIKTFIMLMGVQDRQKYKLFIIVIQL